MTKKESAFVKAYENSNRNTVFACYNKPSLNKQNIEDTILKEMDLLKGFDYRILSYNCMQFTCAFRAFDKKDEYLYVFTKTNFYKIPLQEGK